MESFFFNLQSPKVLNESAPIKKEILEILTEDVLYEDIYLGNSSELAKVDQLFDQLLELIDGDQISSRIRATKILNAIQKIVNNIFNIKLDLKIDYKRSEITNVAYTMFKDNIQEILFKKVKALIIKEETGYQFIRNQDVMVRFEEVALIAFKDPLKYGKNKKLLAKLPQFTGRHLTEILLHEIGHNVFIPFNMSSLGSDKKGKKYQVEFGNTKQKPIIVYPATKGVILDSIISGMILAALMCIPIVGSIMVLLNVSNADYMRVEKNANTLPLQYGYAKEIFDSTLFIKQIANRNTVFNNALDKLTQVFLGYQGIIKRDMVNSIKVEIMNINNDPEAVKYLDSALKYNEEVIKVAKKELKKDLKEAKKNPNVIEEIEAIA